MVFSSRRMYQTFTKVPIEIQCSFDQATDDSQPCSYNLAGDVNTTWEPPQVSPLSLHPRPLANNTYDLTSGPVPSQDCTDLSFTHPDWLVDGLTYIKAQNERELTGIRLNFTVTSRVTQAIAFCSLKRKQAEGNKTDQVVQLSCGITGNSANESDSIFEASFDADQDLLSISQTWTCGEAEHW
jgi:hypothetical protein